MHVTQCHDPYYHPLKMYKKSKLKSGEKLSKKTGPKYSLITPLLNKEKKTLNLYAKNH